MFAFGLPVRGVLHEGEFLIKEHCLAGSGIVESYQLCEKLNFSGLVCTSALEEKIESEIKGSAMYKKFILENPYVLRQAAKPRGPLSRFATGEI